MKVVWDRLIRFVATDGRVLRGEPILPSPDYDIGCTTEKDRLQAKLVIGNDIYSVKGDTKVTDEIVTVKELLGPLAPEEVPILRCVGLNYAKHSIQSFSRVVVGLDTFRLPDCFLQSKRQAEPRPLFPSSYSSQTPPSGTTTAPCESRKSHRTTKPTMKASWWAYLH